MAKHCVSAFVLNGTSQSLMQISDFTIIPSTTPDYAEEWFAISSTDYVPSGVSSLGENFYSVIPSSNITLQIENYNLLIERQITSSVNRIILENVAGTALGRFAISVSEQPTKFYWALILDDDGFADILTVQQYPSQFGSTKGYHFGGNSVSGRRIYNSLYGSIGGGATHIATETGLLSALSMDLSKVLIVAGGGGGCRLNNGTMYAGADAGGISGNGAYSGNQSSGYDIGIGQGISGGSGLYGGYNGTGNVGGGAGSGYIANENLSNKKMVGYNVPTSNVTSTKTESVKDYSSAGKPDKPKSGNGKARIRFLRNV